MDSQRDRLLATLFTLRYTYLIESGMLIIPLVIDNDAVFLESILLRLGFKQGEWTRIMADPIILSQIRLPLR